ncbi:hypothetical protein PsYK624_015200 [Phanerochaete sordida]|uniref:Uncharacterized protein n=1 Tax=Phanerochaete sordida TaxID=48140 RepID=A0A9P3FZI0_9APHY|nr:hypothetical protein PsYK624_015200 [Phanerochaete sordida]
MTLSQRSCVHLISEACHVRPLPDVPRSRTHQARTPEGLCPRATHDASVCARRVRDRRRVVRGRALHTAYRGRTGLDPRGGRRARRRTRRVQRARSRALRGQVYRACPVFPLDAAHLADERRACRAPMCSATVTRTVYGTARRPRRSRSCGCSRRARMSFQTRTGRVSATSRLQTSSSRPRSCRIFATRLRAGSHNQ